MLCWSSLLVVLATLGSINASILTGARTNYAVGQDISPLSFLGSLAALEPVPPQQPLPVSGGAIALALVGLGTLTRQGFETMVDYTAPVFLGLFSAQPRRR